ncbi:YigZ family protein [Balneola sp. MJW-20]|uniref:YigZ family protein n=1 Tax=Gracilimonas aurantiaca TaxID=3234185 RepID=UPI0034660C6C
MKTVTQSSEFTFKEKGSEFIALLFPCEKEQDFQEKLESVRKDHYNASHHCYGWRIDPFHLTEFSSDDGEPSGTAGLPILNAMRSSEMINCGIIVIRYYGGTKLGKPGLIEAYGGAAGQVINNAQLKEIVLVGLFSIEYDYPEERVIQKIIGDQDLRILDQDYMEKVTLKVACDHRASDKLIQQLESVEHLGISFEDQGTDHLTLS